MTDLKQRMERDGERYSLVGSKRSPILDDILEEAQIDATQLIDGIQSQKGNSQGGDQSSRTPPLSTPHSPDVCLSNQAIDTSPTNGAQPVTPGHFFEVNLDPFIRASELNDAFWDREEYPV